MSRQGQSNNDPNPMAFSPESPPHVRRRPSHGGTDHSGTNDSETAHTEQQRQSAAQDGSRASGVASETHGIVYGANAAPTLLAASTTPSSIPISSSSPTEDLRRDMINLLTHNMEHREPDFSWCFEHAQHKPPISPESLAELDMTRIINNPKLRHDINFDRDLHFRANADGSKARQKAQQAEQYWKALEAEFLILQRALLEKARNENVAYWDRVLKGTLPRLPELFASVRDILKTLVPDHDQEAIMDRLDADHIMQELRMGVCDLIDLGNWLANILKRHCAPMRDDDVDEMQQNLEIGAAYNRHDKLVSGLQKLTTILENMKLDVANHQIRHLRPLLIDDTVNFQQRYNAHRISLGKISIRDNQRWLHHTMQDMEQVGLVQIPVEALVVALIRDMMFNEPAAMCPPSFYLDQDRIRALRIELHNTVYHKICRDILTQVAGRRASPDAMARAYKTLHTSVAAIVGSQGKFSERLEYIAVEIVRVLLVTEGQHPPHDEGLVQWVERELAQSFARFSGSFMDGACQLQDRLVPRIQAKTIECIRKTAAELQNIFVPPLPPPRILGFGAVLHPVVLAPPRTVNPEEDLVNRFTHIIVLHWQVWQYLVYIPDETNACPYILTPAHLRRHASPTASSASSSPTVPIAQAVFAPGHPWIPISVTVTDLPVDVTDVVTGVGSQASPPHADESARGGSGEQSEDQPR